MMKSKEALALLRQGADLLRDCGLDLPRFKVPAGTEVERFEAIQTRARALIDDLDELASSDDAPATWN